jgi:hypothetical protein
MEQFQGNLVRGGQTLAENVSGRLTIDFSPTREQRWSGFFNLPTGVEVKVNDVCELILSDGRIGRVKLERVNVTNQGVFVSFGPD